MHTQQIKQMDMAKMGKGVLPGLDIDGDFDKDNLVSFGKQTKNVFHLWLIDEIGDSKGYLKWFDILQNATEDDLVVIHINCWGGLLMTAVQLITQIKTCHAHVVCQVEASCCSAATLVALACDGMCCYPHAYMMIHTSSGCSFGKQSDIKRAEDFYNPWLENLFAEMYKHFLTGKEIKEVLGGKDMWLNADEVMERFKRRVEVINRETNRAKREHMKKLNSFMSNIQSMEGGTGEGGEAATEDVDATPSKGRRKPPTRAKKAKGKGA